MKFDLISMAAAIALTGLPASASSWKELPSLKGAYLDVSSIRSDTFPKLTGGSIHYSNGIPETVTYRVAWLMTDGIRDEVVFDCHGRMAVLQQAVPEKPVSKFQSFDNTESFRLAGVSLSSVVPDSMYDAAEPFVCK